MWLSNLPRHLVIMLLLSVPLHPNKMKPKLVWAPMISLSAPTISKCRCVRAYLYLSVVLAWLDVNYCVHKNRYIYFLRIAFLLMAPHNEFVPITYLKIIYKINVFLLCSLSLSLRPKRNRTRQNKNKDFLLVLHVPCHAGSRPIAFALY